MESDSDIPLALLNLVFFTFLLLYGFISLLQHSLSGANGNGISAGGKTATLRAGLALSPYKYACLIALALTGFVLAISMLTVTWWVLTLVSLSLLVIATVLDRLAFVVANRWPSACSRITAPVLSVLVRNWERRQPDTSVAELALGTNGQVVGAEIPPPVLTEEELVNLDEKDREMFRSIIRLDVSTAREIMVPRLDMVAVDAETTIEGVAEKFIESGHSRMPVFEETLDQISGVIHARDVMGLLMDGKSGLAWREAIRPAFFIPESKRLDGLLEEMQQKSLQFAIVVDEYGGTEGLVTMEDLLEEIVGEIEDEFSRAEEPITKLADGAVILDAGVTTEDVEELFGTPFHDPDVDTVGGYVYRTLGRIPQVGDKIIADSLSIEVISVLGRRLRKLRVEQVQEVPAS